MGDHRIAMAAAIAASKAVGESVVINVECVNTSCPNFVEMVSKVGMKITELEKKELP